jgi:hypothetical protein
LGEIDLLHLEQWNEPSVDPRGILFLMEKSSRDMDDPKDTSRRVSFGFVFKIVFIITAEANSRCSQHKIIVLPNCKSGAGLALNR